MRQLYGVVAEHLFPVAAKGNTLGRADRNGVGADTFQIFAFYDWRTGRVSRQIVRAVIFLPFLMPPIVTGLSLLIAFRELIATRVMFTIVVAIPCWCCR
jgi:hypothetical protein